MVKRKMTEYEKIKNEYEKIENEYELRGKWLDERSEISSTLYNLTKNYPGTHYYWESVRNDVSIPKALLNEFIEITEKELEDFDAKGYEGWLKEREGENYEKDF